MTIPKYDNQSKALNAMKIMVDNGLVEEAKEIAIHWGLEAALPEAIRLSIPPPKVKVIEPFTPSVPSTKMNLAIWLSNFITQDKDMLKLKEQVKILAPLDFHVLIQGETGTGKEIIAHALHGERNPDKFIALNCAGMPEHLIESELFGHEKGSFTGAEFKKVGLLEEANDGTLFLDEVGDLPYSLQAKFLRALQDKKIRPVGSNKEKLVTCRIIAASHHDLEKLVGIGNFRDDLYARLSTFELKTKPIRERLEDIPHILKALTGEALMDKGIVWDKVNLRHNYRSMQKIVKRFNILGEIPICL